MRRQILQSKSTSKYIVISFLSFGISTLVSTHPIPSPSSSLGLIWKTTFGISKRGIVSPTNDELLHNSIGFATIPIFSLVLRSVNKILVMKAIHIEDICMLVAMSFYIALLVLINISAHYSTNLYPAEEASTIFADPKNVADRVLGSKIVVGLEQSMMAVTWLVKLCIWFFLKRVCTNVRSYEIALYTLLVYIIIGFLIVEIAYYAILCQPFSQYWAMPVKNPEYIFLFFLPTWIVLRSKMLPKQRLICLVPFSLALITIIFAILNKYYNFASPTTTTYQLWYLRESSMAIGVANLICSWQLFKKVFNMASFQNSKQGHKGSISPHPINSPLIALGNCAVALEIGVTWRQTTAGAIKLCPAVLISHYLEKKLIPW